MVRLFCRFRIGCKCYELQHKASPRGTGAPAPSCKIEDLSPNQRLLVRPNPHTMHLVRQPNASLEVGSQKCIEIKLPYGAPLVILDTRG